MNFQIDEMAHVCDMTKRAFHRLSSCSLNVRPILMFREDSDFSDLESSTSVLF